MAMQQDFFFQEIPHAKRLHGTAYYKYANHDEIQFVTFVSYLSTLETLTFKYCIYIQQNRNSVTTYTFHGTKNRNSVNGIDNISTGNSQDRGSRNTYSKLKLLKCCWTLNVFHICFLIIIAGIEHLLNTEEYENLYPLLTLNFIRSFTRCIFADYRRDLPSFLQLISTIYLLDFSFICSSIESVSVYLLYIL